MSIERRLNKLEVICGATGRLHLVACCDEAEQSRALEEYKQNNVIRPVDTVVIVHTGIPRTLAEESQNEGL